jgi:hypothetical protein
MAPRSGATSTASSPSTCATHDGKLTFGELLSADVKNVLKTHLDLDADVRLELTARTGPGTQFPSIRTDFEFGWGHETGGTNNGVRALGFNNVRINPGEFISDTVGPILEKIQKVLAPLQKVADVLTKPLPVVSDLAGQDITILDLAKHANLVTKEQYDQAVLFVQTIKQFSRLQTQITELLRLKGFSISSGGGN